MLRISTAPSPIANTRATIPIHSNPTGRRWTAGVVRIEGVCVGRGVAVGEPAGGGVEVGVALGTGVAVRLEVGVATGVAEGAGVALALAVGVERGTAGLASLVGVGAEVGVAVSAA
jgi:hypothetical protein